MTACPPARYGREALAAEASLPHLEAMPVYLVLAVGVGIAIMRSRARIAEVEPPDAPPAAPVSRKERWATANGAEKCAFVIIGASALVWLLLILPIGFAAAAVVLGIAVWKRPYLEPVVAPVALAGGALITLYDLIIALVREEHDWGALAVSIALFGAIWMVIGALLWTAGRSHGSAGLAPPSEQRTPHRSP